MELTPSEKLKNFFADSVPTKARRGEVVLRPTDLRSSAFYIHKGYAKDTAISHTGREFTIFIFKPEDIFSYTWIFNKVRSAGHTFRAMTECILYEKNREAFLLFLEKNPDVQFMITQRISTRMRGLILRMEQLVFGGATQKVASIMEILAERFGKETTKGIQIQIPLTQQDIADLIGISRETTSIEINKLVQEGVIERNSGNYVIKNSKKLQRLTRIS